jgi:DNA-binding transcriptional LysR family regulator
MMQHANWNDYHAFLAIARHGQLGRAAQAIGVNATTMGRRLRRLEASVGATLFEQTREGQVLTQAGETLLSAVEQMDQAASAIDRQSGGKGLEGNVRISVSEGFGNGILARHLGDFARRHPELDIDLVASNGFLSPSRREADIAVMLSRPRAGPLMAGKLTDYTLRLYATQDYLSRHGTPIAAVDLTCGHRLIGYIPDLLYAPELRYLAELHPDLAANLRSSSILAQHRMIAAGAGLGVLPCFIGDQDADLLPVLPELVITRSFWVVTHKDTHTLARIRAVKDWLTQVVAVERKTLAP